MFKKILILGACLLLASCFSKQMDYSNLSLVVSKPLVIFPGSASAYTQEGKNTYIRRMDRYKPYCALEANRVAERQPYQIDPEAFQIKSVYSDYNYFGVYRFEGIRQYRQYLDDQYGPFDIRTVIEFEPNNQGVRQLNCIRWSSDGYDFHLNIDDINEILGVRSTIIGKPLAL